MHFLSTISLFIKLGFRNILKYRRRSLQIGLITLIGALVMTFIGGFSGGFMDKFMAELLENTAHAKVFSKGYYAKQEISPLELAIADYPLVMAELKSIEPDTLLSPSINAGAVVSRDDKSLNLLCQGIQPYTDNKEIFPTYKLYRSRIVAGHFFDSNAEKGLLVSSYVITSLNARLGDKLIVFTADSYGSFNAVELPVIGVFVTGYKDKDENICLMDLADMQTLTGLEGRVTEISLFFDDIEKADTFKSKIPRILNFRFLEYHTWKELLGSLLYAVDIGKKFQYIMYLIFLVVAGVGIMNTVLISVFDRIRDIGTLRAIGFTKTNITAMITTELLIIGVVAALVGTAIGGAGIYYLSVYGIPISEASREAAAQFFSSDRIYARFAPVYLIIPFIVASLVPVLASLYPLFLVRRMKVKEALGYL